MSNHRTVILELHRQGNHECDIINQLGRLSPQKLVGVSSLAMKGEKHASMVQGQFPYFIIMSEEPHSPDLNPTYYSARSILKAGVCGKRHHSLEAQKESREEWGRLSPDDLRPTAKNFTTR
ncbi:unnamed protein product [Heligmosomoides polygyrus]|uniref:Helitron helicase n=1 Tax=Heligmosomoides polygyrus TaxID=6339 RepID=A0A183GGM1_HELPZ|nr:unnamed protein product [Heligmosomoides polygyrus]